MRLQRLQCYGGERSGSRKVCRTRRITPTTLPPRPACRRSDGRLIRVWPSRDPIGERGGLNLYGFVGNCPICQYDVGGLYGAGDHTFLTTEAFDAVDLGNSWDCRNKMLKTILKANHGQDGWGIGGNLWENRRHYNRDVTSQGNVGQSNYDQAGRAGDGAYGNYLNEEEAALSRALQTGGKKGCKEALKAIGRLSHS